MVTTTFSTLTDGFQYLSLFDQAFAQCGPYGSVIVTTSGGTYTIPLLPISGIVDNRDVLINGSGSNSVQLPNSSLYGNAAQSIIDIAGTAATDNITILPFGTQKIRGQNNLKIVANYGGYTLWPIPTGGWYLK
jgi:hypothetical protein